MIINQIHSNNSLQQDLNHLPRILWGGGHFKLKFNLHQEVAWSRGFKAVSTAIQSFNLRSRLAASRWSRSTGSFRYFNYTTAA